MPGMIDELAADLQAVDAERQRLKRQDFSLSEGTADERTQVAEYQPDLPIAFRQDVPLRLVIVAAEQFTHSGGSSTDTFNLSNDLLDTPNSTGLILFDDGDQVQPDSINYSGDSFDYTDSEASTLHAFYVARNPGTVEIEVEAPRAQGNVSKVVFDDATSLLNERDMNQQPVRFDFDTPLEGVVPPRWYVRIYADVPYAVRWDDSPLGTTNGDVARNAIVSLPVRRAQESVENLSQAVKREIVVQ